jgi:hypothetical protein
MQEVVDQIRQSLTDDKFRGKLVVILAGYAADIDALMTANAGLASRFSNTVSFPDFTPADCCQLLRQALASQQFGCLSLTPAAAAALPEMTARLAAAPRFGNGRTVKDWAKGVFSAVGERKFGAISSSISSSSSSSHSSSGSADEGAADVTVDDLDAALQVLLSNMAVRSDAPTQLLQQLQQQKQLPLPQLQMAPLPQATATATATAVKTAVAPPQQQQQQQQQQRVAVEDDWEEVEVVDTELNDSSHSSSYSLSSEELAALVAAGVTTGVSPDSPLAALLATLPSQQQWQHSCASAQQQQQRPLPSWSRRGLHYQ